ncbi:MAG TPA: sigma-70 family RNA polymerase sigma factor [Mycobacteriales bacterium]|nr:sigma-70 family RNA polymerase sigma factor [Mycobacteriales bacterium]
MYHDVYGLYLGCYRRLVAQAFALTVDLDRAQDAVDEAFARALAAPRAFGRVDDPESWLRITALGLARRRERRRALVARFHRWRRYRPDQPDRERDTAGPEPAHGTLLESLRQLPGRERDAVALHRLAGMTVHEIANLFGYSDGVVHALLDSGGHRLSTGGRGGG